MSRPRNQKIMATVDGYSVPATVIGVAALGHLLTSPETQAAADYLDGVIQDLHERPYCTVSTLLKLGADRLRKSPYEFSSYQMSVCSELLGYLSINFPGGALVALTLKETLDLKARLKVVRQHLENTNEHDGDDKAWARRFFEVLREEKIGHLVEDIIKAVGNYEGAPAWTNKVCSSLKGTFDLRTAERIRTITRQYWNSENLKEKHFAEKIDELLLEAETTLRAEPEIVEDFSPEPVVKKRPVEIPLPVFKLRRTGKTKPLQSTPAKSNGRTITLELGDVEDDIDEKPQTISIPKTFQTEKTDDDLVYQSVLQVMDLPLDIIEPCPDSQPRAEIDWVHVQEVADSIREIGQRTPITVRRFRGLGKIQFRIIGGENRYWAKKVVLKHTHIRSIINSENLSDDEVLELAGADNVCRQDYDHMELAVLIRKMMQRRISGGLSRKEASEQVGRTLGLKPVKVINYDNLNNLIPEFQKMISRKNNSRERLPITAAFQIATLSVAGQREILAKSHSGGKLRFKELMRQIIETRKDGLVRTQLNQSRTQHLSRQKPSSIFERVEVRMTRVPEDIEVLAHLTAEDIIRAAQGGGSETLPYQWLEIVDIAIHDLTNFREILRQVSVGEIETPTLAKV